MSKGVADLLIDRRQTVAISESAAGGLMSAALLAIPGASAFFVGGGVIYTRDARRKILNLSAAQTKLRGATEDYALLCARTIRERLGTTWALGESGAAGPDGNRYGDEAGHCCFAVSGPIERCMTLETEDDDRESNMWAFAMAGLSFLEATITTFAEAVMIYGIGNCDTCQAARKWFTAEKINFRFHNFETDGLDANTLNAWISEHGWEDLLNKRSKTWRALPEAVRKSVNPASAAALMMAHPKLIKRPLIDFGEHSLLGFDDSVRAAIEDMKL